MDLWTLAAIGGGVLVGTGFLMRDDATTRGKWIRGQQLISMGKLNRQTHGWRARRGFRIGKVAIPKGRECEHCFLAGSSGSGKSTLIIQLLQQIEARGQLAVVLDPKYEFFDRFYKPERGDVVLNPADGRCPFWSPWLEIRPHLAEMDAEVIAGALFRTQDSRDFWISSARTVLKDLIATQRNHQTVQSLRRALQQSLKELSPRFEGTDSTRLVTKDSDRQSNGTLSTLVTVIQAFNLLPEKEDTERSWSTRDYAKEQKGWVFLSSTAENREATLAMQGMWLALLAKRLLSRTKAQPQIWFILDELPTLGYQPDIMQLAAMGRSYGIPLVIGFQNVAQLRSRYGREDAKTLTDVGTKIIYQSGEPETTQWGSEEIGQYEAEVEDHRVVSRALVMPEQIQQLKRGRGFITFKGHHWARLKVGKAKAEKKHDGFQPRAPKWTIEKQIYQGIKSRCGRPPDYEDVEFRFESFEDFMAALDWEPRPGENYHVNKDPHKFYGWVDKEKHIASISWMTREENMALKPKRKKAVKDGSIDKGDTGIRGQGKRGVGAAVLPDGGDQHADLADSGGSGDLPGAEAGASTGRDSA